MTRRIPVRVEHAADGLTEYWRGSELAALKWRFHVAVLHEPPFLEMSPCPNCGAIDGEKHDVYMHVDEGFKGEKWP